MAELDSERKRLLLAAAISSLHDEFVQQNGRHPEGSELPAFLQSFRSNHEAILRILDTRNVGLPWTLSSRLETYANFWVDLHRNIQYEKLPRSKRPPRDVT